MLKNNLTPPPPKVPLIIFKPNATMITMTADDEAMNIISWIHDFPSQNPF